MRQALHGIVQHQAALVNDQHPVADGLHLGKDMGREDNAVIAAQLADEIPDFPDLDGVEPDRRFIENHHRGACKIACAIPTRC